MHACIYVCMDVCVCVYVCMIYIYCMYACMCVYMHTCMHVNDCVCACVCKYTCLHTHQRTRACPTALCGCRSGSSKTTSPSRTPASAWPRASATAPRRATATANARTRTTWRRQALQARRYQRRPRLWGPHWVSVRERGAGCVIGCRRRPPCRVYRARPRECGSILHERWPSECPCPARRQARHARVSDSLLPPSPP